MNFTVLAELACWAVEARRLELALDCERFGRLSPTESAEEDPAPRSACGPRSCQGVLCLAESSSDRLTQLAAVLSVGRTAIWPQGEGVPELLAELPVSVRNAIALTDLSPTTSVDFGVVLFHGEVEALQDALRRVPDCDGPIVKVLCMAPGAIDIPLEALVTHVSGGEAVMATLGRLRAIRCHP